MKGKIYRELVKHGATEGQATMYCNLVDLYVDLSKQDCVTEKHHILPRQCGWFKKYENAKWNFAVVSWQLHGSLHAFLCHIFPTNESLFRAARITSNVFRGNEKKLRIKSEIIRLYHGGKTANQIGKTFNTSSCTIRCWLKEWKIVMHSSGESNSLKRTGNKKVKHKDEIIQLYQSGKSVNRIGRKFNLSNTPIYSWLIEWKVPMRSCGEALSIAHVGNKKSKHKDEIIQLYQGRKLLRQVGKKFNISPSAIREWLIEWKVPMRSHSESRSIGRVGNKKVKHKDEIIRLYRGGKPATRIAEKFNVSAPTIYCYLREWGIPIRKSSSAEKHKLNEFLESSLPLAA